MLPYSLMCQRSAKTYLNELEKQSVYNVEPLNNLVDMVLDPKAEAAGAPNPLGVASLNLSLIHI